MSAPSFRQLLLGGGPRFLRDAFGPPIAFYVGFKLHGLVVGVAIASTWTLVAYVWERRHGRPGVTAGVGLGIAIIQAVVGLVSRSAIGYFAPPVLANVAYGLAFFVSVAIRRPLAGGFASEMHPVPPAIRASPEFRGTFSRISLVWGFYLLGRSAARVRVAALQRGRLRGREPDHRGAADAAADGVVVLVRRAFSPFRVDRAREPLAAA